MILAVDIGNTNIVIGCCMADKIICMERITTRHNATAAEYAISLKNIFEINNIDKRNIKGAIISSVVPSVTDTVRAAVNKLTGTEPLVIGPGIKTGLSIKLDNPAQVGSDLVVDAVAGVHEYGKPLIIFDLGTATTVSVINNDGEYIGGMIIPGMMVSLESMVSRAAQLPKIRLDKPKKVIGTNTIDCMKSGIMHSTASSIDGIIDRIRAEMGDEKIKAVATGGLAGTVIPLCCHKVILDDELLIKGLMIIYNKNCA